MSESHEYWVYLAIVLIYALPGVLLLRNVLLETNRVSQSIYIGSFLELALVGVFIFLGTPIILYGFVGSLIRPSQVSFGSSYVTVSSFDFWFPYFVFTCLWYAGTYGALWYVLRFSKRVKREPQTAGSMQAEGKSALKNI